MRHALFTKIVEHTLIFKTKLFENGSHALIFETLAHFDTHEYDARV